MTSDPGIERRLSRLENETESIYELIDDFRNEVRSQIGTLRAQGGRQIDDLRTDTRGQIDDFRSEARGRFDSIEETLTASSVRFDRVEATLAEVIRRLPEAS